MDRLLHKLVIIVMIATLIPGVQALSFGSLLKQDAIALDPGEEGELELLLWNRDGNPFPVALTTEAPDGWDIRTEPESFIATENPEGEKQVMVLPNTHVIAKVVRIVITAPEEGDAEIIVHATAGNQSGDLAVLQERVFTIHARVETSPPPNSVDGVGQFVERLGGGITGFATQQESVPVLAVILFLIIGFIAWRWYRE